MTVSEANAVAQMGILNDLMRGWFVMLGLAAIPVLLIAYVVWSFLTKKVVVKSGGGAGWFSIVLLFVILIALFSMLRRWLF